jgi:hypothetical protein
VDVKEKRHGSDVLALQNALQKREDSLDRLQHKINSGRQQNRQNSMGVDYA